MDAEDGKQFDQRASCISDQYSQYVAVDDIKVNGQLTLGENVADLGGLMLAYVAWKTETRARIWNPIDGFTPEQRFFIGYGQSWCANTRDETKRMYATIDPHSPDKYRINGVVSNVPEFQQAFQCKAGSADGAGEEMQSVVRAVFGRRSSVVGKADSDSRGATTNGEDRRLGQRRGQRRLLYFRSFRVVVEVES